MVGPTGLKIRQMLLGKREMLLKVHLVVMTDHAQTLHLEVILLMVSVKKGTAPL